MQALGFLYDQLVFRGVFEGGDPLSTAADGAWFDYRPGTQHHFLFCEVRCSAGGWR